MGTDPRDVRRTTEDLYFEVVDGPDDYAYTSQSTVRYVAVADQSGLLGYLWGSDAEDAAGFEPRPAAGGKALNAGVMWIGALRQAKARGLPPSQALAELSALPGNDQTGHVVAGSDAEAPSQAALIEMLAQR